jgi:hypothetical protein
LERRLVGDYLIEKDQAAQPVEKPMVRITKVTVTFHKIRGAPKSRRVALNESINSEGAFPF